MKPDNKWQSYFDSRQKKLIENCKTYAANNPAGVPGHNLMVIVAIMARILDDDDPDLIRQFSDQTRK